jgi:release factor glutamine methyltransferase
VNVREALLEGRRLLESIGSDEAPLESELLLMHAMRVDRVHLFQRLNYPLPPRTEQRFRRCLDRRADHEPTAYIMGTREFFGLEFEVTRAALIPRPETEVLVQIAAEWLRRNRPGAPVTVADVGVGCGTIAVALATELPNARLIAIDTSKRALALARRNSERHGVADRIEFAHGSILAPLTRKVDVIASNLPYVRTSDWLDLPPEIHDYEPRSALDGGPDGFRLIRRLLQQAPDRLTPGGALFAEIGDDEGADATSAAKRSFPDARIEVRPDLAGLDRVLCVYA